MGSASQTIIKKSGRLFKMFNSEQLPLGRYGLNPGDWEPEKDDEDPNHLD